MLHVGHGVKPSRSLSAERGLLDFPHTRISGISQSLQPIWLDLQIHQVKIDEPQVIWFHAHHPSNIARCGCHDGFSSTCSEQWLNVRHMESRAADQETLSRAARAASA